MTGRHGRRRASGVVVAATAVLAVFAAGCGDETPATSAGDRSAVPPTRAASAAPQPTGANPEQSTVPPRSTPAERSQPWWKPTTSFRGDGGTTTAPFDIEPGVVQWRITWKCQEGTFTAVPVKEPGGPGRPLVSGATCSPQGGTGFSSLSGRFALTVTATGPWEITVDQQVDHPLIEDPLPEMAQAKVVSTATLYGVDRTAKGTARIYQLPDGRRAMRLENFFATANVDLEIRLSEPAAPKSTDEVAKAPFARVDFLKATAGSMNLLIPADIDLARYRSIVVWCEITHNAYGAGTLQA